MSLVGRAARNHPQQVQARPHLSGNDRRWRSTDETDDREITDEDWAPLHERFRFTIDAAAAPHNAKLPRYWTRDVDALAQSWAGETVWCNPPYSDIEPWVGKAWDEHPSTGGIVMLCPANRTEQGWWQRLVEPFRDQAGSPLTVSFLRGRMRFLRPGAIAIGPNERPPFGCVLLIWHAPTRPARQLMIGGREQ